MKHPLLNLDCSIHARPSGISRGAPLVLNGRSITPLAREPSIAPQPFAIGFEQAAERLAALDAMIHLEPDGWFIWHSPTGKLPAWQINGNLYDRQDRLWYVPLRGTCPRGVLEQLLAALADDPRRDLMFELTRAGIFVDLEDLIEYSRV